MRSLIAFKCTNVGFAYHVIRHKHWLKCKKKILHGPRCCDPFTMLTCMTHNYTELPLANRTAARFPGLIASFFWHYEAAVLWQHSNTCYNNTTEGISPIWHYTCYFSLTFTRDLQKRWGAMTNKGRLPDVGKQSSTGTGHVTKNMATSHWLECNSKQNCGHSKQRGKATSFLSEYKPHGLNTTRCQALPFFFSF